YAGWRVIKERRDPAPGARKVKAGGRQADRPKISRAPEDVIRVQVINEPLVTLDDFERVQQLMALKKSATGAPAPITSTGSPTTDS
ncbi:MAG: recombinase family protein, partial [Acidobacteriota bacterium]|nr:recombinase family protein [Acidobacteriota bacterium]